jgi:hypothetical protein
VQFIWASPDCRYLSRAASQHHWSKSILSYRNYLYSPLTSESQNSINLVSRTVEIINHFKPLVFFIENPIGRIPHLPGMRSLPHYRYCVNYADWGFSYSKETYIFTNQLLPLPTSIPKHHSPGLRSLSNRSKRSLIPSKLIEFLIDHSNFHTTIKKL